MSVFFCVSDDLGDDDVLEGDDGLGHLIEGDIEQGAGGHPLQDSYGQQMASTRLKARTYDQSKLKKR